MNRDGCLRICHHEEFKTAEDNFDRIEIPAYVVDFAKGVVSESLRRNFGHTLRQARKKERDQQSWRGYTLFLTGGGNCEPCFEEKLREKYSDSYQPKIKNNMLTFPTLQTRNFVEKTERLAVAAGLSYPLAIWPEQVLVSQVEDEERKQTMKILEADDEPG